MGYVCCFKQAAGNDRASVKIVSPHFVRKNMTLVVKL